MNTVVSPHQLAETLQELWSPRVIAELDDYYVKVAKLQGEFGWHRHRDEDELFQVLQGELRIEMREQTVRLRAGELFVVPRDTEHNPCAEQPCLVLLVERKSTAHSGDSANSHTRSLAEQLRPLTAARHD